MPFYIRVVFTNELLYDTNSDFLLLSSRGKVERALLLASRIKFHISPSSVKKHLYANFVTFSNLFFSY